MFKDVGKRRYRIFICSSEWEIKYKYPFGIDVQTRGLFSWSSWKFEGFARSEPEAEKKIKALMENDRLEREEKNKPRRKKTILRTIE